MATHGCVLLTGATGLLGHYLLRDFSVAGLPLAVIARASQDQSAAERVAKILTFWSERLGRKLPFPRVIEADFGRERLDISTADRSWLGRNCRGVVHAAGSVSFRSLPNGDPWRTNVEGTAALLRLCRGAGIHEWHQVSTAYVCGRRQGTILEEELDSGQEFHNPYEESKLAAEKLLRQESGMRVTTYRPAVIVGDSATGYTSTYSGFYRFLEIGARLADVLSPGRGRNSPRAFPLRLPGTGNEPCYLVPVDWVSSAITKLVTRPASHGRTFHLLPAAPIPARLVEQTAAEELNLTGVRWVGSGGIDSPTRLEQMFQEGLEEHWPYLGTRVEFRCDNTLDALPDLPPACVDRSVLRRLIRFALARDFGRERPTAKLNSRVSADCRTYLEEIFPGQARNSRLGRAAGLNLIVAFEIAGGGHWSLCWSDGELVYVRRGLDERAEVTCRLEATTFDAIIHGRESPQQAFFEERIALEGNVETGLKLAMLFEQFLRENPYPARRPTHAVTAAD